MKVTDLCVIPKADGTTHYQRASYIESGWYIVEDGGEFGIYYIPCPDWAGEDEFHGVQPTIEEALEFALKIC